MFAQWITGLIEITLVLIAAAFIRVRVIPNFTYVPGQFQMALELGVTLVDLCFSAVVQFARGTVRMCCAMAAMICRFVQRIGRGCLALWHTKRNFLILWLMTLLGLLILSALSVGRGEHGDVSAAMRDAVLHDINRISLFGWKDVNPAMVAAITVSGVLLFTALLIRLLVIPRFRDVPGRFQLALETLVRTLDSLAKVASPTKKTFIGAYVFAAGVYIFTGTLFELFGIQAVTTAGNSITLPAPLSDINAAISLGCLSYLVIMFGGLSRRGMSGLMAALKEFSLPISMSFRLFGALLSGLLVTDLVYHYAALRYVVPVIVGVIFTLLHAIVQSYVLTMLVGMYYHEVTEQ